MATVNILIRPWFVTIAGECISSTELDLLSCKLKKEVSLGKIMLLLLFINLQQLGNWLKIDVNSSFVAYIYHWKFQPT